MSLSRRINKEDVVHIYDGILFSHKKNKIMTVAERQMDLEIIMLSEVSQIKTNIIFTYMWNLTKKLYKGTYLKNRIGSSCCGSVVNESNQEP